MYDILYFHGLDSSLSEAKRKILEKFGNVTAPTFNYRDGNYLNNILDFFDNEDMESTLPKPFPNNIKSLSYIVLGKKDIVVRFKDNLDFISEHIKGPKKLLIQNSMAHRIPVDIFEKHVKLFFRILDKKN